MRFAASVENKSESAIKQIFENYAELLSIEGSVSAANVFILPNMKNALRALGGSYSYKGVIYSLDEEDNMRIDKE